MGCNRVAFTGQEKVLLAGFSPPLHSKALAKTPTVASVTRRVAEARRVEGCLRQTILLENAGAVRQVSGPDPLVGFNRLPAGEVTDLERLSIAQQFERQDCLLVALHAILRNRLSDFIAVSNPGTLCC